MTDKPLNLGTAAKAELIINLLNPPIYDDNGNLIGYSEPIISKEDALDLLNFGKKGDFLTLLFSSCNPPNLDPNQKFPQIIMSLANSAGPLEKDDPRFIRGMHPDFIRDGWKAFWNAKGLNGTSHIEKFVNFKPDAFLLWLPFGRTDGRDFDLGDFQAAKADPRLAKVFDIEDFVSTMEDVHHRLGNVPMYFYLGFVGGVAEHWSVLSDSEKLSKMKEALDPYVQLQKRIKTEALPVPVHIIIDTMAIRFKGDPNFDVLMPLIKQLGFGYGGEAWPAKDQTEAKTATYQNIFTYPNLWMDPDVNPSSLSWALPRSDIKGPIYSWIIDWLPGEDEHQAGVRAANLIKTYGHVIWAISWNPNPINSTEIRSHLPL